MNRELAQQWYNDLTSGDYHQTQGTLRRTLPPPGYCCLGVLGRVALKLPQFKVLAPLIECALDSETTTLNAQKVESVNLKTRAKISAAFPEKKNLGEIIGISSAQEETYTMLNDDEGKKFKQIAVRIRKNFRLPTQKKKE